MANKTQVGSFLDLEVYHNAYNASIIVAGKIIPKLPKIEQFDLTDQLRRSSKAIPRLIAEAHSKRHQKKGFQALIDNAMQESNETIVSLSHTRDIYSIEKELCEQLIDIYDKISRQLYKLALAWSNFKEGRITKPKDPADS